MTCVAAFAFLVDTISDSFSSHIQPAKAVGASSSAASDQRAMDLALISLVNEGDKYAFGRLYDRLAAPLLSLIMRVIDDRVEAEDVLQETFVLLWKKASAYDPARSSVFSWAVTLARGKAIDRLRSRQRRLRVVVPASEDDPPEPAVEKETPRESSSDIERVLGQLPPEQRQAIDLAYFTGLTHEEISAKLGQPLGTVKARIRRGLLKLREILPR